MADSAISDEIVALEHKFFEAMQKRDIEAAKRLTADPCIVAGAQGVAQIDRETFGKMMSDGKWTLTSFDITDVKVQALGEDMAVIGYKVREDLILDGKTLVLEAADASTWVRRNGAWVCALHTEAVLGDAYGRDRRKPA